MPRGAGVDLLQVHVLAADDDLAKRPAVLIPLIVVDDDGLTEHQRAQVLLRAGAEGLLALGRVDANQPDLVLLKLSIEHRERVAVGDLDGGR